MSSEWVLQKKIYAALNGVISCPVYDTAPQGSDFPYVTIGEAIAVEFDTDTTIGVLTSFDIHAWSEKRSRKECKLIIGEIYNILHLLKFTDAAYTFTQCYFVQSNTFVESDGITRHGVIEFKVHINEV